MYISFKKGTFTARRVRRWQKNGHPQINKSYIWNLVPTSPRPATRARAGVLHHWHLHPTPTLSSARVCVCQIFFPRTIFCDRIHSRMSVDQIPVFFVQFEHFVVHLGSKWYTPLFHTSPPPVLVDDVDTDICIHDSPEACQIHVVSSHALLVNSSSRFVALAECTLKNSCFGDCFLLSSLSSPGSSMSPRHVVQRAATNVSITLALYSYGCPKIALASESLALARYANALCDDVTYSASPRSCPHLACSRVHAAYLC